MTEWAEEARTRQGLYRFVGAAFRPPDAESFEFLGSALAILDDRDIDQYAFSRQWRKLASTWPMGGEQVRLEAEYVRLFASGVRGAPAPPVESNYRVSQKGGGVAEFTANLQREYRAMGLITAEAGEAPDHAATEFDVMSYLYRTEAEAWESDRSDLAWQAIARASRFLDRHLAIWIPLLSRRVSSAQPATLYLRLAEFAHALVIHDADFVRILLRQGELR
jgi:TorA maturation chaperone TorD